MKFKSGWAIMVVIWAMTGSLAASGATVYTDTDGSTFDVTDGILTVTVPDGIEQSGYDYVANILNVSSYAVTNIVKAGTGVWCMRDAQNYTGDWDVLAGVLNLATRYSLGAQTDAKSKVWVRSGASLWMSYNGNDALSYHEYHLAGNGTSTYPGVVYIKNSSKADSRHAILILEEDATVHNQTSAMWYYTTLDTNGHNFYQNGGAWANATWNGDCSIVNSSATPSTFYAINSVNFKTHFYAISMTGGADNWIDATTQSGRLYIYECIDTSWSLKLKNTLRGVKTSTPLTCTAGWKGPVTVSGTLSVYDADNHASGYGLTFYNTITGDSNAKIVLKEGSWLGIDTKTVNYAGNLELKGNADSSKDKLYRCALYVKNGSPFLVTADKTVTVYDSDIWMDADTVRTLPTFNVTGGKCTITGSAAGSTIAALTVADNATVKFATPASVSGTLTVGTGVTLDLDNRDIAVQKLVGCPKSILNGGTITVGNFTVDVPATGGQFIPAGDALRLSETANVAITFKGGDFGAGIYEALYFSPGSTVPALSHFAPQVKSGFTANLSTRIADRGEYAGWTALVVAVSPTSPIAKFSTTDTDGTTLVAEDQTLTISVPAGVTNAYAYASLVSEHAITNIVKKGVGGLRGAAIASYYGDITIKEGYFIAGVSGAMGASYLATVHVQSGAGIALADGLADQTFMHNNIYLAGAGPDGHGAFRGGKTGNNGSMRYPNFSLTDDAWFYFPNCNALYGYNWWVDLRGHAFTLNVGGSWSQCQNYDLTLTNSVAGTPGVFTAVSRSPGTYGKLHLNSGIKLMGGADVIVRLPNGGYLTSDTTWGRVYVGKSEGDAKLELEDGAQLYPMNATQYPTNTALNDIYSDLKFLGSAKIGDQELHTTNQWVKASSYSPLSLYGSFVGTSSAAATIATVTHLFAKEHDFAGSLTLNGVLPRDKITIDNMRITTYLHDGAAFPGGVASTVTVKDMDVQLDDHAAYALPTFDLTQLDMTLGGGAAGGSAVGRSTAAGLKVRSSGTLTVAAPVEVTGTTEVTSGTLALSPAAGSLSASELPVFDNLVFSAGTTFDMNAHALTVPKWTGTPTIANAAALTISGEMAVDGSAVKDDAILTTSGALVFADDSKVTLNNPRSLKTGVAKVLATAQGGVTIPSGGLKVYVAGEDLPQRATVSDDGKSLVFARTGSGLIMLLR